MLLKVKFKHYVLMSSTVLQIWLIHVVVSQRTEKKCTAMKNARAERVKVTVCFFIYSFILAQRDTKKDWNMQRGSERCVSKMKTWKRKRRVIPPKKGLSLTRNLTWKTGLHADFYFSALSSVQWLSNPLVPSHDIFMRWTFRCAYYACLTKESLISSDSLQERSTIFFLSQHS